MQVPASPLVSTVFNATKLAPAPNWLSRCPRRGLVARGEEEEKGVGNGHGRARCRQFSQMPSSDKSQPYGPMYIPTYLHVRSKAELIYRQSRDDAASSLSLTLGTSLSRCDAPINWSRLHGFTPQEVA